MIPASYRKELLGAGCLLIVLTITQRYMFITAGLLQLQTTFRIYSLYRRVLTAAHLIAKIKIKNKKVFIALQ